MTYAASHDTININIRNVRGVVQRIKLWQLYGKLACLSNEYMWKGWGGVGGFITNED